ncbi:monooxygenase [Oceanisphaera pacifica]|uniref:Monooxygenase n=1 Tax=Oceanisphaera pacifica TaxID=2818389 RepID=A0ABS3NEJ7_9GAMM|nr:monooxygenase [Oceanisphaera pacifica]MBO1519006.1 monooxygenase [Oceanisphaera pacifica]
MAVVLQIDFTFPVHMMGEALTQGAQQLAHSINEEPGFISKIWTENTHTARAGGIYIFTTQALAQRYASMHTERVAAMGATDIKANIFDINTELTDINHGHYQK